MGFMSIVQQIIGGFGDHRRVRDNTVYFLLHTAVFHASGNSIRTGTDE